VATGTAEQTQAMLQCEALSAVGRLLVSGKRELKKEACWLISNVTAGSAAQIDAVCASGLAPLLIRLVSEEEFDIKKEAAYALCNACTGGSLPTISGLVFHGVLGGLCSLLEAPDAELLLAVIEALGAALEAGDSSRDSSQGDNRCVHLMDKAGGIEKLEALQLHENPVVYEKASHLLDTYFADADGVEDSSIAPVAVAEGFRFGVPVGQQQQASHGAGLMMAQMAAGPATQHVCGGYPQSPDSQRPPGSMPSIS